MATSSGPSGMLSGPSAPGPAGSPGPGDILLSQHKQNQAAFDQISKASGNLEKISKQLDMLEEKGDTVQPEDVIEAAGRLVASGGFSPSALAGILADMPTTGGPALAGWIQTHIEKLEIPLQQIAQAKALAAHKMGVGVLHLAASHVLENRAAAGLGPSENANSLSSPGGPV